MNRMRPVPFRLAVLAISVVFALPACGGSDSASGETTTSVVTTTTEVDLPLAPLTGVGSADAAALSRPALVAKIDNHPAARPQSGLNQADIVFEENVEQLTRFAAVFHSTGSDPVGPLRSGRTQDIDLLGSFNKPLFVWSGGNARVTRAINNSDLVNLGPTPTRTKNVYFRESSRRAPHNLYTKTSSIWALAPAGSAAPQPQFVYRGESDAMPTTARAVRGAKVSMDGVKVLWEWDAASGLFGRSFLNNKTKKVDRHLDLAGQQVAAHNVIVLQVVYKPSKADRSSPEAQTIGTGEAFVLTDGMLVPATWERASQAAPFTLKDAGGSVIRLTPGRTFVQLARKKTFAEVAAGVDPATVVWK